MIQQPVIPRIPVLLQASGGVSVDPNTGAITVTAAVLTVQQIASIQAQAATLPTSDPHVPNAVWLNGGVLCISQG